MPLTERFSQRAYRLSLAVPALAALLLSGCFPRAAGPRLHHFHDEAPQAGDPAPRFELRDLNGQRIALDDLLGTRPVVLQLGSHTCPVYRYRRFWMERIYRDFSDQVEFLLIYTTEAHPVGSNSPYVEREWVPTINRESSRWPQTTSDENRTQHAKKSREQLEIVLPMVVDNLDNQVWQAYGRAPSPAFVLDPQGQVVESMVWIDPKRIRQALTRLLAVPK